LGQVPTSARLPWPLRSRRTWWTWARPFTRGRCWAKTSAWQRKWRDLWRDL